MEESEEIDGKAKNNIVALYMESLIYFTIPLCKRLELVNRQYFCDNSRKALLYWVKTGYLNYKIEHQIR